MDLKITLQIIRWILGPLVGVFFIAMGISNFYYAFKYGNPKNDFEEFQPVKKISGGFGYYLGELRRVRVKKKNDYIQNGIFSIFYGLILSALIIFYK